MISPENASGTTLPLVSGILLVLASLVLYIFHKPAIPRNAPRLIKHDTVPLIGAVRFFTHRLDFMKNAMHQSSTGHFTFYVGQHPVVGVSGKKTEGRQVFFEDRRLGLNEGYTTLGNGAPEVKKDNHILGENNAGSEFGRKFSQRLAAVMKGSVLRDVLPQLLSDLRSSFDQLAQQPDHVTDPFDSIYRLIFNCTMRVVACNEIADDPRRLTYVLDLFEGLDAAKDFVMIMYPWLPTASKFRRLFYGSRLYMVFKDIIDQRKAKGRRGDDTLQYLIDQGDNVTDIITFVLGALSAGQINGGINTAALLCYLANNHKWMSQVRDEVSTVANRYATSENLPLKDRLILIPLEAWETEFPTIDICFRETIRIQMCGTLFRQNTSNTDIVLDKQSGEVIPSGFYAAMAVNDILMNEEVYQNPNQWDPDRYLPERAEDKKQTYAWMGWGVARHPCLGMRLAKLENNLIVSFFLMYFDDLQTCDKLGNPESRTPYIDRSRYTAHRPKYPMYLKYHVLED